MTKSRTFFPVRGALTAIVFLVLAPTAPALADSEGTLTVYLNGGQYWFDDKRLDGTPYFDYDLDDGPGGGIGFGYNLTDRWAIEGVYDYFSVDVGGTRQKVDVENYHFDLLFQFAGRFCGVPEWQPYVVVGAGELRVNQDNHRYLDEDNFDRRDYPDSWHRRQTMVNFGVGVKYELAPRWQVRGDVRGFQGVEEGGLDSFVSFAIGYQWQDEVEPRDWDGDGIYSNVDQCPQTPVGIDVDQRGCPLDSDGDGIPDYLDQCPNTPMGMAVNEDGCPREGYDPADFVK
ncbi:outer membrane beta-barrel protein [Microbulbifer celer]|uniref:Outer membrane beta-barrel protein n=1 Tax=Microbulbifer celer TaxID=435905 RepID=A0ABW3U7N9_9GAMM|nr:outer membrane beta-barrel protein [Microbulbifer celer]UFN57143.1 outer membrane beta-barrel protein [Microbulbifer celer]